MQTYSFPMIYSFNIITVNSQWDTQKVCQRVAKRALNSLNYVVLIEAPS